MAAFLTYKSARLRKEFHDDRLDIRLRGFLLDLSLWQATSPAVPECDRRYLFLTCINRTKEENKAVGGHQYSGHMDWRCVDFRANDLLPGTIGIILDRTAKRWPLIHLICHGKGPNRHFHAGILYADRISI